MKWVSSSYRIRVSTGEWIPVEGVTASRFGVRMTHEVTDLPNGQKRLTKVWNVDHLSSGCGLGHFATKKAAQTFVARIADLPGWLEFDRVSEAEILRGCPKISKRAWWQKLDAVIGDVRLELHGKPLECAA